MSPVSQISLDIIGGSRVIDGVRTKCPAINSKPGSGAEHAIQIQRNLGRGICWVFFRRNNVQSDL